MKLLLAMPVVAMCGTTAKPPVDAPGTTNCSMTLSGALTGTYACTAAAAFSASSNTSGLSLQVSGFSGMATVSFSWQGQLATGTYRSSDANAKGGASIVTGSGASTMAWVAAAGSGAPVGAYDLTVSSVTVITKDSSGSIVYGTHGMLDATLQPETGQTAITISAQF